MPSHTIHIPASRLMPQEYFDNPAAIAARVAPIADPTDRLLTERVLEYLYLSNGRINNPLNTVQRQRDFIRHLLEPAEWVMFKYLATRTNGSGRKRYGEHALRQMRGVARYVCEEPECRNPDVFALQLDHVDGNRLNTAAGNFRALCASCHQIKSRRENWTGKAASGPVVVGV
jgi:hypothetical protein